MVARLGLQSGVAANAFRKRAPFAREAVDVRRFDERVTRDRDVVPAQVVNEHDDDVGSLGGDTDIRESGDRHEQKEERQ